jgi:hypothetical protein
MTKLALVLALLLSTSLAASPTLAHAEGLALLEESVEGEPLEEGAELQALSSNFVFESAEISVLCTETELQSLLTENGGPSSEAALTGGRFEGAGPEGRCETTSILTASIVGPTEPWIFDFFENGELTVTGEEETPISLGVDFYLGEALIASCEYETSSLVGEFELYEPLGLTLPAQEVSGSGAGCPESGSISGSFEFTSGGKQVVPGGGKTITLRETGAGGAALAVNSEVEGTNSNTLIFAHPTGNVQCANDQFTGKVTQNGKVTAGIEILSTTIGTGGGRCTTPFKEGGVPVTATITPENTPWNMIFRPSGFGNVNGTPGIELEEAFFKGAEVTPLARCYFTGVWPGTSLAFGFPLKTAPIGLSLVGLNLPLNKARSMGTCPPTGNLSVNFTVKTKPGKEPVYATSP